MHRVLASRDPAGLAAYSIADPRWADLPEETRLERLAGLFEHVARAAGPRDVIAISGKAVLVGLFEQPDSASFLSRGVMRNYWGEQRGSSSAESFGVLSTSLAPHEVRSLGPQALTEIERRLDKSQSSGSGEPSSNLPFPLAVLPDIVESRSDTTGRIRSLRKSLSQAVRFLSAIHLATALRKIGPDLPGPVLVALQACMQPAPASVWEEALFQLAQHVQEDAVIGGVASALVQLTRSGPRRSEVGQRLREALTSRSRSPGTTDTDGDDLVSAEKTLRRALTSLLHVCRPLSNTRLVSLESVNGFDERSPSVILYRVREHHGPKELFPVVQRRTSTRMLKDWCYLFGESGQPLLLGPLVACRTCACQRTEVFLADHLVPGPPGSVVTARAATSDHRIDLLFPQDKVLERLFDRIREKSAS